jgi:hypothetical protein
MSWPAWGLSDAMQARGWEYEARLTGELDGIMHVEDTEGGLGTVHEVG